jgi:hypothetical protein
LQSKGTKELFFNIPIIFWSVSLFNWQLLATFSSMAADTPGSYTRTDPMLYANHRFYRHFSGGSISNGSAVAVGIIYAGYYAYLCHCLVLAPVDVMVPCVAGVRKRTSWIARHRFARRVSLCTKAEACEGSPGHPLDGSVERNRNERFWAAKEMMLATEIEVFDLTWIQSGPEAW